MARHLAASKCPRHAQRTSMDTNSINSVISGIAATVSMIASQTLQSNGLCGVQQVMVHGHGSNGQLHAAQVLQSHGCPQ